jgi:hypothetical protein
MDIRALSRQGYTYAEIGRMVGRDWRTVKRYLETGAQPVYRRKRMPSKLDEFKPVIDQWLAKGPSARRRPTARLGCHGSDSHADPLAVTAGDHRTVCSPQPAAADRRPRIRGVAAP